MRKKFKKNKIPQAGPRAAKRLDGAKPREVSPNSATSCRRDSCFSERLLARRNRIIGKCRKCRAWHRKMCRRTASLRSWFLRGYRRAAWRALPVRGPFHWRRLIQHQVPLGLLIPAIGFGARPQAPCTGIVAKRRRWRTLLVAFAGQAIDQSPLRPTRATWLVLIVHLADLGERAGLADKQGNCGSQPYAQV
jgi:hypothetical protein